MTELPSAIKDLEPGTAIKFDDMAELSDFEDLIAAEIDPGMTVVQENAWVGRLALGSLVRPSTFHGVIGDIVLFAVADPYERLWDARERGVTFTHINRPGNRPEDSQGTQKQLCRGFKFAASASSSGKGVVGEIQAELWYLPVPTYQYKVKGGMYTRKQVASHGGSSVRRIVSKPIKKEEAFINLDETSRQIAYRILRSSIQHPIIQPFHN